MHSLYKLLAGFAFHFGKKSIHCRIFPHMSVSISQSSATKNMTPLLPVTFHGAESPWTLVPVSTIWFAMVRMRLYLTDDVTSRFNRHRFKLVLSLTPWVLLNSCTFFDSVCEWMNSWKFKVILMIIALQWQRKKERLVSPALMLLHYSDFLSHRLTAKWIPVDGQTLRRVVCLQQCCSYYWSVNMTCLRISHHHGNNKWTKFH